MRNHVSKVLVGTSTANTNAAPITLAGILDGKLIAFDFDTRVEVAATTVNLGFAMGTPKLGEPIIAGPIPVRGISSAILNPYEAAVPMQATLTVTAVPNPGETALFKVIYQDNLSILPNKMKQTLISIVGQTGDTTASIATAIAAEFNKQEFRFVNVSAATNVVTFVAQTISTASAYNGIDRPESVVFEIGAPVYDTAKGVYAVAVTVPGKSGQGDPAKIAWLEDQAMGRRGFSDRRSWNDTRQYKTLAKAGTTYATLVINADAHVEGDMQDLRANPVGVILAGDGGTLATIVTDLARAGVVPTTVAAS